MDRRLSTYLVAGSSLSAACLTAPPGLARALLWQVLIWGTVAAVVTGMRVHRPTSPRTWGIIAIGIGAMATGELSNPAFGIVTAYPTSQLFFDLLLASGYPLVGVGAVRFARAQSEGEDHGPVLDSLIVTIALTTVLWEAAVGRESLTTSSDPTELIAILVMSFSASWVAAMTVRFHLAGGYRAASGWFLIASSMVACLGSATFALHGTIADGVIGAPAPVPGLWMLALLLVGAAALHPSMIELTRPSDVAAAHVVTRAVLPAVALLVPPTAIIGRYVLSGEPAIVATFAAGLIALLVVARFSDLMRTREQAQRQLRHQTLHDPLTGLPNRRLLDDRLRQALLQRSRDGRDVGVAFLDLDGFKALNDSLGHAAGDDLLVTVAGRMRAVCRASDTLARLGGDEFVLVLDGVDQDEALQLADRLLEAIRSPIQFGDEEVRVDASVGIALASTVGHEGARLMVAADDAMYAAKGAGRGRTHLAGPVGTIHDGRVGRIGEDLDPWDAAARTPTPHG